MLDWMEGRLNTEEELQLQEFLVANPELAVEMEDFTGINLIPEAIVHPDRESLKMPEGQDLLLIHALETDVDSSEFPGNMQKEFSRYKKTILIADERIIFPNKESLKKEESTPIIPLWLGRLAIAASLIGVVLTLFFQSKSEAYEPRLTKADLPVFDLEFPEAPYENLAEQENNSAPTDEMPVIDRSLKHLAQEENQSPRGTISEKRYAPQEIPHINLAQTPDVQSEEVQLEIPELDLPDVDIAQVSTLEGENIPIKEDEMITEVSVEKNEQVSESSGTEAQPNENFSESKTTKISSALDILKRATRDSDLLAFQNANEESAYVETSVKIGRFKFDVKRRKRN